METTNERRKERLPEWMTVKLDCGENYTRVRGLLRRHQLHTVCQSARCPNQWECWNQGTATFMVLGGVCTRGCKFCGVPPASRPAAPDPGEPAAVAEAVAELELNWAVVTSVTRDDLPDGGAGHFAACVAEIRKLRPECGVELLIPDFGGSGDSLRIVAASGADVIGHNVETVPRLYERVRPEADYGRSLDVLRKLVELSGGTFSVKSSLMVGLGETEEEIAAVMSDLAADGCDSATLGQYLPPSKNHLPVERYYTPEEFDRLADIARAAGIAKVASGPKVRSSYMAHNLQGKQLRDKSAT
jgi:lipoic acid synthetase